jgi:hypothetical protein
MARRTSGVGWRDLHAALDRDRIKPDHRGFSAPQRLDLVGMHDEVPIQRRVPSFAGRIKLVR